MTHTVIGVYDSYQQAQDALSELQVCGFSRQDVQLSPAVDSDTARQAALRATAGNSEDNSLGPELGLGSGFRIGNFFRSLFGLDDRDQHAGRYAEAVRRGSCVLTVNAVSDDQRDQAMEVMDRYDPVDLDERSSQWKSQGWSQYDAAAPNYSDMEIEQERQAYQRSGAADGEIEIRRGGARSFRRMSEASTNESVQRRMEDSAAGQSDTAELDAAVSGLGATGAQLDDEDFRRHWQTAYAEAGGSYEDVAPAYQYGSTLASDERYRSYLWGDVEPEARVTWESNNAGSHWEKARDAIRYGWERLTGKREN